MSKFIQIHAMTSYPPANLNRDDLGRPKTAIMGGAQRLRVSSQSLKRAWRTSDLMQEALQGHVGLRTKAVGRQVEARLVARGLAPEMAKAWAHQIAARFGKVKDGSVETEQLAHFAPEEMAAIEALVDRLDLTGTGPSSDEIDALLQERLTAADIALFGRMLADAPKFNVEAAAQVAHAISVHEVAVEEDFFTAVDDLNTRDEDLGAGHMGETEFASGLFYLYVCIDRDLLIRNLGNDAALADRSIGALVECIAKIGPTGKQATFASRAYASYIQIEKGVQQPRSLAVSFLKPIRGKDLLSDAIQAFEETQRHMDEAYGACAESRRTMNVHEGKGTLPDLLAFIKG